MPEPWVRPWENITYGSRYDPRRDGVLGYPSSGCVLVRSTNAVELSWLGLDRFEEADRSLNQDEEDRFCQQLKMLGAQEYATYDDWQYQLLEEDIDERSADRWDIETGWPTPPWVLIGKDGEECSSGVWVWKHRPLSYQPRTGQERVEYSENAHKMRLLDLTLNMEERCRIIEKIGGVWYDDWRKCQELR